MEKISLLFRKERISFLILINVLYASVFNITGKHAKALHHINKAVDYYNSIRNSLKPGEIFDDTLYCMKAGILEEIEKFDEALIFINEAIKINPKQMDLYEKKADILFSLEDFSSAIEDYSNVLNKDQKRSDIYIKRGLSKYHIKDYGGAITDYTEALNIQPKASHTLFVRGGAKFGMKDYIAAIEDFTKAIKLDNRNYKYYFERGKAQTWLNNHDAAIADYSKAIKINSKVPKIYFERAIEYYNFGKKNLALNDVKTALNLIKESDSLSDFFNYCKTTDIAYILFQKDKKLALNFLIDIEKNCTKDKDLVYTALSYMFFDMDNYKKALKYANLAILKNPQNGTAYYHKKCALEKLGRKEEAKECYDKAIKLGYKEEI